MNYRFADGSDKIAAFERGMTDEELHAIYETPGTVGFIVAEQFLVAYRIDGPAMIVVAKQRLYGPPCGWDAVNEFLDTEARSFGCTVIQDRSVS